MMQPIGTGRTCKWKRERGPHLGSVGKGAEVQALEEVWESKQGSLTILFLWKTDSEESIDQTMRRYMDGLEWNIRRNL